MTLASLIPVAGLLPLFTDRRSPRQILTAWLWMGGGFLLISGWWFVRNWLLYAELLGDHWKVNPEAFAWDLAPKSLFSDYFGLQNFWRATGISFVGNFGFMHINMPQFFYPIYLALLFLGLLGTAISLARRISIPGNRILLLMVVLITVALAQLIYLNLRVSQPQGRYLLHVAVAIVVVIVHGIMVVGITGKELLGLSLSTAWRERLGLLVWPTVLLLITVNLYTLRHVHSIYGI